MMLISTANITVKSSKKRKKVSITLPGSKALAATHVGNMSCMVQGCLPISATIHPDSLAI